MVFQNYALYPHMSVNDNIGYSLKLAKVNKTERAERIAQVAKLADLSHLLDRRPSQLSGGQRQRVAIARAVVREPGVLLFDEPLSNLDAQLRHDMRVELANLHERIGSTSVFVTHDQVEAMTLADKILIINKGKIEQFAAPDEIYHRPRTTFVAGFIGAPPMNLIEVKGDGTALRLSGGAEIARHGHSGDVIVGIRPENLTVSDNGTLKAKLLYREDLGSHRILLCELQGGAKIRISVPHGSAEVDGSDVLLSFRPEAMHLFDPQTQIRMN